MSEAEVLKCNLCESTHNVSHSEVTTKSGDLIWTGNRCNHCVSSNIVPVEAIEDHVADFKDAVLGAGEASSLMPHQMMEHLHNEFHGIAIRTKFGIQYFSDWMLNLQHQAYGWWHKHLFAHLPWLQHEEEPQANE